MALSIQRAGADGYWSACSLPSFAGVPGDPNPLPIDPRPIDRRDTDESLLEERTTTDELLGLQDQLLEERNALRADRKATERLIRDLLDFGSFEDGRLRVAAERLDIRTLLQGACDAFHSVAAAKHLALTIDVPTEPVMAKYDPHRLFQVLSNLIHAIKFTPESGAIRLRAARVAGSCQVSVSDTGVGIPEGDLTSIFERFRQLDRGDRTGLGLGLYIALWIVEAHGGRIWAESAVGSGTTFHFTLPEE